MYGRTWLCSDLRDSARRDWVKIWRPSVNCVVGLYCSNVIYSDCGVTIPLIWPFVLHYPLLGWQKNEFLKLGHNIVQCIPEFRQKNVYQCHFSITNLVRTALGAKLAFGGEKPDCDMPADVYCVEREGRATFASLSSHFLRCTYIPFSRLAIPLTRMVVVVNFSRWRALGLSTLDSVYTWK